MYDSVHAEPCCDITLIATARLHPGPTLASMASGLAPVKPEFIRRAGPRVVVEAVVGSSAAAEVDANASATAHPDAGNQRKPQTATKKSRRQQQKVRLCLVNMHRRTAPAIRRWRWRHGETAVRRELQPLRPTTGSNCHPTLAVTVWWDGSSQRAATTEANAIGAASRWPQADVPVRNHAVPAR